MENSQIAAIGIPILNLGIAVTLARVHVRVVTIIAETIGALRSDTRVRFWNLF